MFELIIFLWGPFSNSFIGEMLFSFRCLVSLRVTHNNCFVLNFYIKPV